MDKTRTFLILICIVFSGFIFSSIVVNEVRKEMYKERQFFASSMEDKNKKIKELENLIWEVRGDNARNFNGLIRNFEFVEKVLMSNIQIQDERNMHERS